MTTPHSLHNLPQRQREVLHFIIREIEDKDQSPTQQEIANHLGIEKQQVNAVIDALVNKGRLIRHRNMVRGISLPEAKK